MPVTIYLDSNLYTQLIKDIQSFHLNDGISTFIKKISLNYCSNVNEDLKNDYKIVQKILKKNKIYGDSITINNIACDISLYANQKKYAVLKKKDNKISIYLNQREETMLNIPEHISKENFFLCVLYAYFQNHQYVREQIIFKNNLEDIKQCILFKKKILIENTETKKESWILPYKLCANKEKLYTYLLYQTNYKGVIQARSIHLYKIKILKIENSSSENFNETILNNFNKMEINGPQFSINQDISYKVKFSEEGLHIFNQRYLERPNATIIDSSKNIYSFNCSEFQFENYFAPFFQHIEILEPLEMRQKFINYLQTTLNNYKNKEVAKM